MWPAQLLKLQKNMPRVVKAGGLSKEAALHFGTIEDIVGGEIGISS